MIDSLTLARTFHSAVISKLNSQALFLIICVRMEFEFVLSMIVYQTGILIICVRMEFDLVLYDCTGILIICVRMEFELVLYDCTCTGIGKVLVAFAGCVISVDPKPE